MSYEGILEQLRALSDPKAVAGMAKFGINTATAYGVSIPNLRKIAKHVGRNHIIAQRLWTSGIHEAKILASFVDEPKLVTEEQMEKWVKDFKSWDVCDQCCSNLFDKTRFAYKKALEWSRRDEEFVKRAGFVLMAALSVHDKKAKNSDFQGFLLAIKKGSDDDRNFVKKAVNWALRQIGKRNTDLNKEAIRVGEEILEMDTKSGRWIASDALHELTSKAVQDRLSRR